MFLMYREIGKAFTDSKVNGPTEKEKFKDGSSGGRR
jgi:hypothetical protein